MENNQASEDTANNPQGLTDETAPKEDENEKKRSDKVFVITIAIILIVLIAFFSFTYFIKKNAYTTVDDVNKLNIEGKLKPDEGYVYKGVYSFIKIGGLWYTQLKTPTGITEYNVPFHFGPRDAEGVKITGSISDKFASSTDVYITFNPLGNDLTNVALAVGEFDQSIVTAFGKKPVAACDRNETDACHIRPIITCENKEDAIVYFKEDNETKVSLEGNCIVIQGKGSEIVRATDRLLLRWYQIMD